MVCTPMWAVFVVCLMSFHWAFSYEELCFGTWPCEEGRGRGGSREGKPPTGFWLFQGECRFNYRRVVDFQLTYFPHGFLCFSSLTQSFDMYEPERKKSHTMSPKQKGALVL